VNDTTEQYKQKLMAINYGQRQWMTQMIQFRERTVGLKELSLALYECSVRQDTPACAHTATTNNQSPSDNIHIQARGDGHEGNKSHSITHI